MHGLGQARGQHRAGVLILSCVLFFVDPLGFGAYQTFHTPCRAERPGSPRGIAARGLHAKMAVRTRSWCLEVV